MKDLKGNDVKVGDTIITEKGVKLDIIGKDGVNIVEEK